MKVFKFGGASVRSADGVKNLAGIVRRELQAGEDSYRLFIIVSAMGKTTNALETVTEHFMQGDKASALGTLAASERYHLEIAGELFGRDKIPTVVGDLFESLKELTTNNKPDKQDYELWYDRIVSHGELLSTAIISQYLKADGIDNTLLDMRRLFVTDGRHRDANIDMEISAPLLQKAVTDPCRIFIGQGFIGGAPDGETVTLGREGSDYSAAAAAYILDARSVTIWKDVEGILNADPKFFTDTTYIPELTYLDAIELAYSGAQIIHPKTIKPLQNKDIPLYVRPFGEPAAPGSVIKAETADKIDIPVLILKHNQVLVSIRPLDFSFVMEERYADVFTLLERYNIKINLVQSSAVNLSISVDRTRRLPEAVEELKKLQFRVVYNDDMELLTIRGYTKDLYEKIDSAESVYITQKTRRIVRVVRKKHGAQ